MDRQKATKLDVFRMGTILIKKLASTNNELMANYAKKKEMERYARKITRHGYYGTYRNTAMRAPIPRTRKAEKKGLQGARKCRIGGRKQPMEHLVQGTQSLTR